VDGDVIICKQKIRIQACNEKLAFSCSQYINEIANTELPKMFERIFHQTVRSDKVLKIDSIKIDIGSLAGDEFNDNFIRLVEQKIINELVKQFEANPQNTQAPESGRNDQWAQHEPAASLQYVSQRQQNSSALFYFLENGNYPWWYKKDQRQPPAELLAGLDAAEQSNLLLKLISKARNSSAKDVEQLVKRLVNHLDDSAYNNYIDQIVGLFNNAAFKVNVDLLLKQKEQFISIFGITLKVFHEQVLSFVLLHADEGNFFKAFLNQLMSLFPVTKNEITNRINALDLNLAFHESLKGNIDTLNGSGDSSETLLNQKKAVSSRQPDKYDLYIENAGLVLLHPFLPAYFHALKLTNENDQFISVEAQTRAAVLLYYLQSGDENYKEWEMALNKILCGLPASEVIVNGIGLTEEEKEESRLLLQTVIGYWEALKGSGIAALQNTFILREGKVTYKDDYWLIQVERSGFDILLDRLPWGIGTIKLPWLKELIYCEW
jgi:hypothetical protein